MFLNSNPGGASALHLGQVCRRGTKASGSSEASVSNAFPSRDPSKCVKCASGLQSVARPLMHAHWGDFAAVAKGDERDKEKEAT